MTMKKLIALLSITSMLLVGCGAGGTDETDTPSDADMPTENSEREDFEEEADEAQDLASGGIND